MISPESLVRIGDVHKPHGVRGELNMSLNPDGLRPADLRCVLIEMDGIPVPFFIESARPKGDAWLVKLEGIDDEIQAAGVCRRPLWALRADLPESEDTDGVYLHDLVGFRVEDETDSPVGEVTAVDDTTANVLLYVRTPDGREVMLPFSDDLLLWLDADDRTLGLSVPAGLLELN